MYNVKFVRELFQFCSVGGCYTTISISSVEKYKDRRLQQTLCFFFFFLFWFELFHRE